MTRRAANRYALALVMAGAGVSHFVVPKYYARRRGPVFRSSCP